MKIIHEISYNGIDAVRLFTSFARERSNNMRIHYHAMAELSLILRGSGIYRTDKAVYKINAGDIFFYRPNEAHCITDISEGGMELLNLHIAPYYFYTRFPDALSSKYIKVLSSQHSLKSNKLNDILPSEDTVMARNIMLAVRNEYTSLKPDYETLTNNYISSLLISLARYTNEDGEDYDRTGYEKVLSAVAYIDENFKGEIRLDEIARSVGYSKCYFSTIFKKRMGMSAWDYILIKRIEEALTLIKTTDKNILDIAVACGFNNTANFNKIFKKYTNLPPKAFRK